MTVLTLVPPEAGAIPDPQDAIWNEGSKGLKQQRGSLAQIPHNAAIYLRFHPDYRGLRWNSVSMRVEFSNPILKMLNGRDLDDVVTGFQDHFASVHELNIGRDDIGRRVVMVARENTYDPLQDWLRSLVWDGLPRLDRWLTTYCGAQQEVAVDDGYVSFVGRKWLLSTVARAFQPGCKADVVLVCEGLQGAHKSTMLQILGGEWYCEAVGVLGDKDSKQLIGAAWICELPDMAAFSRTDRNAMKAFFTSPVDRYRPPYAKEPIKQPRRAVFAATTNEDEEYLGDPTGNRRFWPVKLGEIDRAALIRDRDQLFAEVVALYRGATTCPACRACPVVVPGEQPRCPQHAWWLSPAERFIAKLHVHLREEQDVWAPAVLAFALNPTPLGHKTVPLTTANIIQYALGCDDMIRVGRKEEMRVAAIMKRADYIRTARGVDAVWVKAPAKTPPAPPDPPSLPSPPDPPPPPDPPA